jgi:hypothetical protein
MKLAWKCVVLDLSNIKSMRRHCTNSVMMCSDSGSMRNLKEWWLHSCEPGFQNMTDAVIINAAAENRDDCSKEGTDSVHTSPWGFKYSDITPVRKIQ